MLTGLIKWFDVLKGFGMVGTFNDGDFFCTQTTLKVDL